MTSGLVPLSQLQAAGLDSSEKQVTVDREVRSQGIPRDRAQGPRDGLGRMMKWHRWPERMALRPRGFLRQPGRASQTSWTDQSTVPTDCG